MCSELTTFHPKLQGNHIMNRIVMQLVICVRCERANIIMITVAPKSLPHHLFAVFSPCFVCSFSFVRMRTFHAENEEGESMKKRDGCERMVRGGK